MQAQIAIRCGFNVFSRFKRKIMTFANTNISYVKLLHEPLEAIDPDVYKLIQQETSRQKQGIELIASENYTSEAVLEANGSILTNKYSEGLPFQRYYGGNEIIDKIEVLCQTRALKAFGLDSNEWGVNVQPYSGSVANFAVYTGLISPNDKIMGLDLPSGGHLTHGFQTEKRKVSSTSIYFNSVPYKVNPITKLIDYDQLEALARVEQPKLIICGASAYPRDFDYKRFREIADINGSYLMTDMAHISGLVATNQMASPFKYSDVVTTTTHKTLRGPRGALIFFRKKYFDKTPTDLESRINQAVFPACQGGPHNNTIAAIAVALKQVMTPEFAEYCKMVKLNCKILATHLIDYGYEIVTGGTDNHLFLWDLRSTGLSGSKMETICDAIGIYINKNALYGDKSALSPGGVRIGTAAITSRGFIQENMKQVAEFLHQAFLLAKEIQSQTSSTLLRDFTESLKTNVNVSMLRDQVIKYAAKFP